MARTTRIAIAFLFVAITFLLAAIQIPRIGQGAPDWHTVKNPQIPVSSVGPDEKPPVVSREEEAELSKYACRTHPPIKIQVTQAVCVSEPLYGWKWDEQLKQWVRAQVGTKSGVRYITQVVTAHWIDSLHCYAFYDNYGRLRMLPDYKALMPDAAMKKGRYAILLLPQNEKESVMLVRPLMPSQLPKLLGADSNRESKLLIELAELAAKSPLEATSWTSLAMRSDIALLQDSMQQESGADDGKLNSNQRIAACLLSALGSIATHDLETALSSVNSARRTFNSAPVESLDRHAALESIGLVRELTDELDRKLSRYNRCM